MTLNPKFEGVTETLLISLDARCHESIDNKGLIHDPKSIEIAEKIGRHFRQERSVHFTNVGTGMRTLVFDRYTQDFLNRYPDGTIINIACGLDTRYHRLNNNQLTWYDLDLPEVISLRKQLFEPKNNHHYIAKSVLDFSWLNDIPKDKPVFLSAEGLFCYLTEQEAKMIFTEVAKTFPKAEFAIEAISPTMVKKSKHHPSLKGYNTTFKWGVDSGKVIDSWGTGFHFVDESFFMSEPQCKKRSFRVRLMCLLFPYYFGKSMKIFRLRNFQESN